MTGEARFCPQCGTKRVGFFRFCPTDGFDYDELLAPEQRRPADPKAPAPTRSSVVTAADLRQAVARPATTPPSTTPLPGAARPAGADRVEPGGPRRAAVPPPASPSPPAPTAPTAPTRANAPAAAAAAAAAVATAAPPATRPSAAPAGPAPMQPGTAP
ncbi:MAG TPA: hypothetical protein VFN41_12845, partial [Candidatus Limnocylindrales bacterium]|nr:hypothetical protein [Candidatus Limnocylindrales bacterium]